MGNFIRSLSTRTEFSIVIGTAFGLSILTSLSQALSPLPPVPFTGAGLSSIFVYECTVIALLALFLQQRDWTFQRLGLAFRVKDLLVGAAIAVVTELSFQLLMLTANVTGSGVPSVEVAAPIADHLGLARVIATSCVNGFFEELFVCGYVLAALRDRRSMWFAINLSTAIRLSYHLYQGSVGVISIVPMGILFGWWYARGGRLWPLVAAHALMDFAALAPFA